MKRSGLVIEGHSAASRAVLERRQREELTALLAFTHREHVRQVLVDLQVQFPQPSCVAPVNEYEPQY